MKRALVPQPPSDAAALMAARSLLSQARQAQHWDMEAAALSAIALIRRGRARSRDRRQDSFGRGRI